MLGQVWMPRSKSKRAGAVQSVRRESAFAFDFPARNQGQTPVCAVRQDWFQYHGTRRQIDAGQYWLGTTIRVGT
eukprot:3388917-Rhodomonas_salina.1